MDGESESYRQDGWRDVHQIRREHDYCYLGPPHVDVRDHDRVPRDHHGPPLWEWRSASVPRFHRSMDRPTYPRGIPRRGRGARRARPPQARRSGTSHDRERRTAPLPDRDRCHSAANNRANVYDCRETIERRRSAAPLAGERESSARRTAQCSESGDRVRDARAPRLLEQPREPAAQFDSDRAERGNQQPDRTDAEQRQRSEDVARARAQVQVAQRELERRQRELRQSALALKPDTAGGREEPAQKTDDALGQAEAGHDGQRDRGEDGQEETGQDPVNQKPQAASERNCPVGALRETGPNNSISNSSSGPEPGTSAEPGVPADDPAAVVDNWFRDGKVSPLPYHKLRAVLDAYVPDVDLME